MNAMPGPIIEWFHVSFNDTLIHIKIDILGRDEINDSLMWSDIIRVCFKTGDFLSSDEILIFTKSRPESYLIPTEADGALDLWGEIIKRGVFDAELAIRAATAGEDEIFCWPQDTWIRWSE